MRGFKKLFCSLIAVVSLSHCSQSRRGNVDQNAEIWAAQEVCSEDVSTGELRCMSIEPNITENYAIVTITQMPSTPPSNYILLGRAPGQLTWHYLAGDITGAPGETFEVDPKKGLYIEEYEEFILQAASGPSSDGLNIVNVEAGKGLVLIQGSVNYPELYQDSADGL